MVQEQSENGGKTWGSSVNLDWFYLVFMVKFFRRPWGREVMLEWCQPFLLKYQRISHYSTPFLWSRFHSEYQSNSEFFMDPFTMCHSIQRGLCIVYYCLY